MAESETILPYDQLFQVIDRSRIERIVDIGCHRGEHIQSILQPNFPDAEIVGVEPKSVNFTECLKLKSGKLDFCQLDCRAVNRDNVGMFDLVWSFGLIYHLDDPTEMIRPLLSITHERSYVCIEGHVASENEQAQMPYPNPPIISKTLDGEVYHGKTYQEFDENLSDRKKDRLDKASLDNPWSFWLTHESMVRMFIRYGFKHVIEIRSSSPTSPHGPGLFFESIDREREWSRRMYLISRSQMQDPA